MLEGTPTFKSVRRLLRQRIFDLQIDTLDWNQQ